MQKKSQVGEASFIGRSFISSVAEEDDDINILSKVFKMGNDRMTELPLIGSHSVTNNAIFGVDMMTPVGRKLNKFFDYMNQLDEEDQKLYLHKLDSISHEADNHLRSLDNSPVRKSKVKPAIPEKQESGFVSDDHILKLEEIKESTFEHKTPFKDVSELDSNMEEEHDGTEKNTYFDQDLILEKREPHKAQQS